MGNGNLYLGLFTYHSVSRNYPRVLLLFVFKKKLILQFCTFDF